jgi:hypothetical protein
MAIDRRETRLPQEPEPNRRETRFSPEVGVPPAGNMNWNGTVGAIFRSRLNHMGHRDLKITPTRIVLHLGDTS